MALDFYVIYTEVNADESATKEITSELGFETCVFKLINKRVCRGREIAQPEFIFPRYAFAAFDIERDPWQEIYGCRGVDHILGHRINCPTPIPRNVIPDLKMAFANGEFSPPPPPPPLAEGEEGRITAGNFVNEVGKCQKSKEGRVQLLLRILGNSPVWMPAHIVERVGEPSNAAIRLENHRKTFARAS